MYINMKNKLSELLILEIDFPNCVSYIEHGIGAQKTVNSGMLICLMNEIYNTYLR